MVLSYSKIWLSNHLLASMCRKTRTCRMSWHGTSPRRCRSGSRAPSATSVEAGDRHDGDDEQSHQSRGADVCCPHAGRDWRRACRDRARYTAAREIFDMRKLWARIERARYQGHREPAVRDDVQTSRLLRHVTQWLLAHRRRELHVDEAVAEFRRGRSRARSRYRARAGGRRS